MYSFMDIYTDMCYKLLTNHPILVQFIDMGFTHEQARLALLSTGSLEEATDYILNHPQPPPARVRVMSTSCIMFESRVSFDTE